MAKVISQLPSGGSVPKHNNLLGLNEGDYLHLTQSEKAKLDGIQSGAEVNVNADWNAVSGDAQILNKPSTFPPSAHTHPISDVTGLPTALDYLQLNKEDKTNKQNSLEPDGTGTKYPTVTAVKNAIDSIYQPDIVIRYTAPTRVGNTFTFPSGGYDVLLSKQFHTNVSQLETTIADATDGFKRIDLIYYKADDTIAKIEGTESATVAVRPEVPVGGIELCLINVFGDTIEVPEVNGAYVQKSERANVVLTGSGVINQLNLVDEKATIVFKGSITQLNTISYASVPYNGKTIRLFNAQATPVTIGHSVSGYAVDFVFPDGQDYVLKPNETIEFSFDTTYAPYVHHMLIGSKGITNWSELQGKPSTFSPSSHTHVVSEITDFPTFKTIEGQSVIGAGNIDLDKNSVGLGNVDNTSDLNKPVSIATQIEINNKLVDSVNMGIATPTGTPTGTGKAHWTTFEPGTYTNYGGVVVEPNSLAIISRDAGGVFSISQTPLDLSSYTTIEASRALVDKSVSVLTNAVNIVNNPTFTNGLLPWFKNEDTFSASVIGGKLLVDTQTSVNSGIVQDSVPTLAPGTYKMDVVIKKTSIADAKIKIGLYPGLQKDFRLTNNKNQVLTYEFILPSDTSGKLVLISTNDVNFTFEITAVYIYNVVENSGDNRIHKNTIDTGNNVDYINSVDELIGKKTYTLNSFFRNGFDYWGINNEAISFSNVVNGGGIIDTTGASNPAVLQTVNLPEAGEYLIKLRMRNLSTSNKNFRLGKVSAPSNLSIEASSAYIDYSVKYTAVAPESFTLMLAPEINSIFEVTELSMYDIKEGSLLGNHKYVKISNIIKNPDFLFGTESWSKNEDIFDFTVSEGICNLVTYANSNVGLLQGAKVQSGTYVFEIRLRKNSEADFYFSFGTYSPTFTLIPFVATSGDYKVFKGKITFENEGIVGLMLRIPTINANIDIDYITMSILENNSEENSIAELNKLRYLPAKNTSLSPVKEWLQPFIDKYNARTSDVTIVQVGDSISTNLGWSPTKADANIRPPFCTEFNINYALEEKLRWLEQRYRRHDFAGVFTEVLGGGVSSIKSIDTYWGYVGGSYYLPNTKVIDGGTNAGVSFKMPANTKRISLIVHSDLQWSTSTVVAITGGNGKVQVYNGTVWVEANGFSTSFKESDTSALGYYKDNAQKRLSFRSLTDLTEKIITVTNVGVGRFGYWGIEYSPNEFMFNYICASKGSQGMLSLERFEEWMVDSFKPDLLIWQLPIINEGIGNLSRASGSNLFGDKFIDKYNAYLNKGYLVLPYAMWGATSTNFIDASGNFLSGYSTTGQFISCQNDIANINLKFKNINVPFIDGFGRVTESAKDKAVIEGSNPYISALAGSGQTGDTFTIDGIHFNELGENVAWRILEHYFNF